jgi:hypothetical protein
VMQIGHQLVKNKLLRIAEPTTYWVNREDGLFVLRQQRYREQFAEGKPHPNDVCAVATTLDEIKGVVSMYNLGTAEWPKET